MARNVLVLKHFESPKEAGTYFRLVTLTGSTKGESYVLMGNRIVIGRGEKTDIKINDAKASREHCEITKVGDKWVATDLGSQNGVMVNDMKITQQPLGEGDKLIVGQTVFKFAKVEVSTKNKVIKEYEPEEEEGKKTALPFIILVVIFVSLFLFDDFSPKRTAQPGVARTNPIEMTSAEDANIRKRRAIEDKQTKEKLNDIFNRGLREYREGNYFRAIHEFNLALIIAPQDSQAEFYLRKSKEELDNAITSEVQKAQRDESSIKYKSAIVSYCSIIRLLYSAPDDPRYKNAEKKIKDLEAKQGIEEGETSCLKKQRTN
ncbi:MAG: FHA domain-containing protein [Bdellovibrionota bacterium]